MARYAGKKCQNGKNFFPPRTVISVAWWWAKKNLHFVHSDRSYGGSKSKESKNGAKVPYLNADLSGCINIPHLRLFSVLCFSSSFKPNISIDYSFGARPSVSDSVKTHDSKFFSVWEEKSSRILQRICRKVIFVILRHAWNNVTLIIRWHYAQFGPFSRQIQAC